MSFFRVASVRAHAGADDVPTKCLSHMRLLKA